MKNIYRLRMVFTTIALALLSNPTFAESGLENKICDEGKYFTVKLGYPDLKPEPGKAMVYLLRASDRFGGFMGARATGSHFWVFTDKKLAAILGNNTYSKVQLNPGSHRFWVKIDRGKAPIQVLNAKVEANKTYYMFVDASALSYANYGTRLWINDKTEFLRQRENHYCQTTIRPDKVAKLRDKFLQKHYEESTTVSNTYPKSLGSSPPNLKRISFTEIEKKLASAKPYNVNYQLKEDIPAPSAGKAMLVILSHGPDFNIRQFQRYGRAGLYAYLNNFIDDKLVSLSHLGSYSIAEVEPGERLFWSSWFAGSGFRQHKTLNATRINFKAGQTYYIDQVFGANHIKHSIPMRVVDKELGKSILHELAWRTVFNKKSRRLEKKLIKKYYNIAKKIATRSPQQQFAGGYIYEAASF